MNLPPGGFGVQAMPFPGQNLMNDPMANMAMQYGSSLADQGKDYVNKNVRFLGSFVNLNLIFL